MVQCHTLLNFSVLLLCFTADLLWNFGFLGIHATSTNNVTCHACPKGTQANNILQELIDVFHANLVESAACTGVQLASHVLPDKKHPIWACTTALSAVEVLSNKLQALIGVQNVKEAGTKPREARKHVKNALKVIIAHGRTQIQFAVIPASYVLRDLMLQEQNVM